MTTPSAPYSGIRSIGSTGAELIRRAAGRVPLPHAKRRRSTANRVAIAVLAGLATLVVVLALDGIWAGRAMFRGVSAARSELTEGSIAVVTGDPSASIPQFEQAAEHADSALAAGAHPSIELLAKLPWVGDNLRAVEAVAEASRSTAEAGLAMAEAAEILGWHDLRLPATEAIGRVDVGTVERAAPVIGEVATRLEAALERLDDAGSLRLLGPIATAYDDGVETLRRRERIAADTRDLVELLPGLLGKGAPRRYLLAVQTLGRPQGSGGEVDLVGVLTARDGIVSLQGSLSPADPVLAQATASGDPTESIDAKTAGEQLLAAAGETGFGRLDGVVLTDSIWLADALLTTGSVEVPDRALPVNADQAAQVLEREVFEADTAASAADRRAEVATAIVDSYLADRPSTEAFATALARDVADRHLVVVATRPRERRLLERLGADGGGALRAQQMLAVTWNTAVDNHAAIFARRDVSHRVSLKEDGSAGVRTVVTLANQSPEGDPSALLGFPLPATVEEPAGVNPVGGWAADVSVRLPPKADHVSAETSVLGETEILKDGGRATVLARLAADPGASTSLIVGYRVADAGLDDGVYRLLVVPQPSWPTGVVRLQLDAPPGSTIIEASDDLEVGGTTARYVGAPTRPFSVWIRFA